MAQFTTIFWVCLVLCCSVTYRSSDFYRKKTNADDGSLTQSQKETHNKLIQKYLFVYLMATFSDWLQGPYVYALYADYGFSQHEIAQLFVAGFGSSMVFGSFVGGIADLGGRRLFVLIFAVLYVASCLTKHFKNYNMLMLGRLLGGISTSLLFSVFEAWLIKAHSDADLPKQCLPKSFSWAAFGNGAIAIMAGLIANHITDSAPMEQVSGMIYKGGYLNPFDLAIGALILCSTGAITLWEENYGSQEDECNNNRTQEHGKVKAAWYDGLRNALYVALRNRDIILCGIISSLFEGSMYIFVFMWTPIMKALAAAAGESTDLPFGLIFATFMVCCMAGSSIFSILVEHHPVEKLGIVVFGVGSLAMALVAMEINATTSFLGMNLFEICVGMYFPIMGTMKGGIVPENQRAAIYNLYRIPLNFIVLLSLLTDLTPQFSFGLNATMLAIAAILQAILSKRRLNSMGLSTPLSPNNPSEEKEETVALVDSV